MGGRARAKNVSMQQLQNDLKTQCTALNEMQQAEKDVVTIQCTARSFRSEMPQSIEETVKILPKSNKCGRRGISTTAKSERTRSGALGKTRERQSVTASAAKRIRNTARARMRALNGRDRSGSERIRTTRRCDMLNVNKSEARTFTKNAWRIPCGERNTMQNIERTCASRKKEDPAFRLACRIRSRMQLKYSHEQKNRRRR